MLHKHHIIPKHAGGTDDPENLIPLTIPEHAEAHRLLWEQYGKLGDKMAWHMLSGRTEEGEALRLEIARQPHSPEHRAKQSMGMKGHKNNLGHRHSLEALAKMSASQMGHKPSLTHKHTPETKQKMSDAAMGNKNGAGHKYKPSLETCAKISARMMGNTYSLGYKRKINES